MVQKNLFAIVLFAVSFAFVESSVVVYLRSIYYPDGFTFPLKMMQSAHLAVELTRELSTIVMLIAVGALAGRNRWEKFAYFLVAFGVWDIFYYLWLKVTLNWPSSLTDWDILFLIPIPWIGPVIAPVVVSVLMMSAAPLIMRIASNGVFRVPVSSWVTAILGTILILFSFIHDTKATLEFQIPRPFLYEVFGAGIMLYLFAFYQAFVRGRNRLPASGK